VVAAALAFKFGVGSKSTGAGRAEASQPTSSAIRRVSPRNVARSSFCCRAPLGNGSVLGIDPGQRKPAPCKSWSFDETRVTALEHEKTVYLVARATLGAARQANVEGRCSRGKRRSLASRGRPTHARGRETEAVRCAEFCVRTRRKWAAVSVGSVSEAGASHFYFGGATWRVKNFPPPSRPRFEIPRARSASRALAKIRWPSLG